MSKRDAQLAFYSHKRDEHHGSFQRGCAQCEQLWARLLSASKQEAGVE